MIKIYSHNDDNFNLTQRKLLFDGNVKKHRN